MQALVQRKVLTGFLSAIVRKMMPMVEREKLSLVTCKSARSNIAIRCYLVNLCSAFRFNET